MTRSFMFIAGEVSGDARAAQLIEAIREQAGEHGLTKCAFFGAGGPAMRDAGADLAIDMTRHTVLGLWAIIGSYFQQKKLFHQLLRLAVTRQPDFIVLVDYGVFNRLFAQAIRKVLRESPDIDWEPKIVYYVSPQVWASRAKRALQLERDVDLMLSIIPFEKDWYARKTPKLRVEWVGHPLVDMHAEALQRVDPRKSPGDSPTVLLLPGSRRSELKRHLPTILPAARRLVDELGAKLVMVLPSEEKRVLLEPFLAGAPLIDVRIGGLDEAMLEADLAIASSGTVTHELALFQVPTVVIYKVNGLFFAIGKRVATVKYLALPNLIAEEEVYPECLQGDATPEKIFAAAQSILTDETLRGEMRQKLAAVARALGEPGAAERAARHVLGLID